MRNSDNDRVYKKEKRWITVDVKYSVVINAYFNYSTKMNEKDERRSRKKLSLDLIHRNIKRALKL